MTGSDNPCANCSNRDCANSLLAKWWDLCVESKFTLFKQIAPPQEALREALEKESEITFEWNMRPDRYLMCRKCKEKEDA